MSDPVIPQSYPVRRISTAIIDWSQAACLSDFTFPWETTEPPRTEFRALWDEERLHFLFDCVDAQLIIGAGETVKERVLGSDRVEIFLTPDLSLNPYYCFEMSPQGEAVAYKGRHYREFDWEWSCPELHLDAEIKGAHYRVQGSLPLETLRAWKVLKKDDRQFYAGVFRAEFSRKADLSLHSGWMPWVNPKTEKADFHVPSAFGIFKLVS